MSERVDKLSSSGARAEVRGARRESRGARREASGKRHERPEYEKGEEGKEGRGRAEVHADIDSRGICARSTRLGNLNVCTTLWQTYRERYTRRAAYATLPPSLRQPRGHPLEVPAGEKGEPRRKLEQGTGRTGLAATGNANVLRT